MNSIYYNKLPDMYWNYLQKDCIKSVEKLRSLWLLAEHSVFRMSKKELLTELGLSRFEQYHNIIDLFRMPPNHIGPIHIDNSYYAFNFIIKGTGVMQWFDINSLEYKYKSTYGVELFTLKSNDTCIVEETDCNLLWANTTKPHRIVTGNEERICLSIRATQQIPYTI